MHPQITVELARRTGASPNLTLWVLVLAPGLMTFVI